MHNGKVVLVSTSGYSAGRDEALLRELIQAKVELFCVVGVDAREWEDAMDWLCVGDDGAGAHYMTTTSHPAESEEEVLEFARCFDTGREHDVEIIRV